MVSTIHTLEVVTKKGPWSDARAHLSVASAGRLAHHRRLPLRATVVMDPQPRGKSVADPLRRDAVELSNVARLDQVRPATAHPLPPFEHQPADAQATATHRARAAPPQEPARAAAAAALYTFALIDEPEVLLRARSRPAEPARQPADSHTRAFRRGAAAVHSESS